MIFDASTLLNLSNGNVLHKVVDLPELSICFGPSVYDECLSIADMLDFLVNQKIGYLLPDDEITLDQLKYLFDKYSLGDGEIECIAYGLIRGEIIACDDRSARRAITNELGKEKLTGSIGLLLQLAEAGLITKDDAHTSYNSMVGMGGFLPAMPLELV